MADLVGIGTVMMGLGTVGSFGMSLRAARKADRARSEADSARLAAVEARDVATAIAQNLERHYSRVESTYEASREATMSLLAYLQGERAGYEKRGRNA